MEVVSCDRLKTAVVELKKQIDELNNDTPSTPSTSSDIDLINKLLDVLQQFYSKAPEGESGTIISLLYAMDNLTFRGDGAEVARTEYDNNKDLYKKMVSFIWNTQSKFLSFVRYMIPRIGHTPNKEEFDEKLTSFLQTLTNTIEQTTAILNGKNDKEKEVPSTKDKKLFSVPKFLKPSLGLGRRAAYDALLEKLRDDGEQGSCTPEQYFSMLHTMGLIAIELCEKYISNDTLMNIESLKGIVAATPQAATPQAEESPSSGGATSRRRRRRRRSHSRKSINRNKKSKKIRKIYTSKRRARRRNQNKSKNKSRNKSRK
jgi:hypothetical protein